MPFAAPVDQYRFLLNEVVGFGQVQATEKFAEASGETVDAILTEAAKLCDNTLAPINRNGDLDPARLENGKVRTSKGFADAYEQISEGGWVGLSADPEYGGMGLPLALGTAVNEMMAGANLALQLCPLLSQGQIEALEHHASDELKELYLPKLTSGEWSGTMNLTEPQAGSDVGAVATKAEPNDDGTYAVTGQKIFITWGDADFLPNVVHLVLARLPGAPAGTKGISLFLVPRNLPDENGNPGVANDLGVVSLEHKLGIHGSPTCVMEFRGAKGWMVGHEGGGMAAMFTMMNNARLGVGMQGVAQAEAAFQKALEYSLERKQGRTNGPTGMIFDHADVRRTLTAMKADVLAARAIGLACAVAIDMGNATGDEAWKARAALLTPIAKAFGTDVGVAVASEGVQMHGGMGFVEETGAAQYYRDVRITPIYEGTNGIQAMDLVGRKMMDGGEAAYRMIDEIETYAEEVRGDFPNIGKDVWNAAETLREATEVLVGADMSKRGAAAVPYLRAFARVLGGYYHLRAAVAEGGTGPRTDLARVYVKRLMPEYRAALQAAHAGDEAIMALDVDALKA